MRYMADFETTQDANGARVWCWALMPMDNTAVYDRGTDMESFMKRCFALDSGDVVYFHNLKYDGNYIVFYLMTHGYAFTNKPANKFTKFTQENQSSCFTALVSSKGQFYTITVYDNEADTYIEFRDSLKLIPMAVRKIAKAFGGDESKGEIDYDAPREVGYQPTDEEWDYVRRDVKIVADALQSGFETGLDKLTIGSNCMSSYRKMVGKRFKKWFPKLSLNVDAFVRAAYRGGFTYVNPKYAGEDVGPGISVDFNSMYPSMMLLRDYPVGTPIFYSGKYEQDDTHPLYVQSLVAEFKLKPGRVPMIQLRGRGFYGAHEYVTETVQPERLTLTSVDLALLFECYDVDVISWEGGCKFMSMPGRELFGEYIDHWGEIKRTATGGLRAWAKLYLNNLYGKFSTNPNHTGRIPVLEDGKLHWVLGDPDIGDPVYIPVGAFVTAYARDTLVRAILANYDRFVYCDTDSMHLLGTDDPADIPLHDTNFGAWKVEGTFTHARHLRAKAYIWDLNGETKVTCAGMPDNVKALATFDNFHFGFTNALTDEDGNEVLVDGSPVPIPGYGKLLPRMTPGGVVLAPTVYRLQE